MAETDLNKRVMAALRGFDPQRIENAVGPGTPDIEYIGGHIEDKKIPAWPKRAKSILKVRHYTTQQRGWHMRRRAAGGRCHVIIEVGDDAFVFDARDAAQHLGLDWTQEDMRREAMLHMRPWNGATFRQFIEKSDADRYHGC